MRWLLRLVGALTLSSALGCGRISFGSANDGGTADDSGTGDEGAGDDSAADHAPPMFLQGVINDTSNPLTSTLTLPSDVTAGNAILVFANSGVPTGDLVSVTDTVGTSFAFLPTFVGQQYTLFVAYGIVASSGPDDVSVTFSERPNGGLNLRIKEYASVDRVTPLEASTLTTDETAIGADAVQVPGLVTTVPNSLLIGYVVDGVVTSGTGWTTRDNAFDDLVEEQLAALPGSYTVVASPSDISSTYGIALRPL